jgi:hypothetical protein
VALIGEMNECASSRLFAQPPSAAPTNRPSLTWTPSRIPFPVLGKTNNAVGLERKLIPKLGYSRYTEDALTFLRNPCSARDMSVRPEALWLKSLGSRTGADYFRLAPISCVAFAV